MSKEILAPTNAPKAIGPYSAGVKVGNMVFTAGQIPLNPETMKVEAETIEEQTHQALKNLQAVLEEGGSSLANVVKTTVFLSDLSNYAAVNAIYGEYFTESYPARSAIQVAALPLGVMVEIEAIGLVTE